MGYSTDFTGSVQIKRRLLKFAISFNSSKKEETPIGEPPSAKKRKLNDSASKNEPIHSFQNMSPETFELVALFTFTNEKSETLHFLRLVCKDFYILTSGVNQNRLFSKIDQKTVTLVNGLSSSRRMIRYRYINGIDYGIDGQYFVDAENFGQNDDKFETLAAGKPISYNNPPRTQPGLWCQWIINEEKQCLEWDGGEKFYSYTEWFGYLVNNILAKDYVLNGSIEWQGQDPSDVGTITVGKVQDIDNVVLKNGMPMPKEKDVIWNQYEIKNNSEKEMKRFVDAINDKEWIDKNADIKSQKELMQALEIKDGYLRRPCFW